MIRRRVLVSGRVQGVWFRDSCRREARARHVTGWARNLDDGRVEAVFEGPADDVLTLVNWCMTGPPLAAVTDVEVIEEAPTGLAAFHIR